MKAIDVGRIQTNLSRRVQFRRIRALTGILVGLPLCFLAPLMLGSLFWFSSGMLFGWHPWTWFVFGSAVILIPLLIHLEVRTAGNFLGEAARDFATDKAMDGRAMIGLAMGGFGGAALARAAANPRAATSGIVEFFLIGPRMLVPGFRHLRGAARMKGIDRARAAEVVTRLRSSSSGVAIKSLLSAGEAPESLGRTLHWLAFYDWIGIGEKGEKVFLFSESRARLGAAAD